MYGEEKTEKLNKNYITKKKYINKQKKKWIKKKWSISHIKGFENIESKYFL